MDFLHEKINSLPDDLKQEALLYIDFLIEKKMPEPISGKKRPCGMASGTFVMTDDFQQPLTAEELTALGFQ